MITLKSGDNFIYPIADGKVKLSGGDQVLKISTFIRDNLEQGEEREGLRGEPDGSHPFDSLPDETEATNDFWSTSGNYIYRHHVEPRVKLYVPKEESFPIRLRYIDETRATSTTPQMYCRNAVSMIVGTLMVDRELSEAWTGFTKFTILNKKKPLDRYTWCGERLTKLQATSRPDFLWPEMWSKMSKSAQRQEKQEWAIIKTEARQRKKVDRHLLYRSG